MTYLLIIAIVAVLIVIYAMISTRGSVHLYYIIPVSLACAIGLYTFYGSVLGYPTTRYALDKFVLLGYINSDTRIFMWVLHDNETEPRAYSLPYTEEQHAQLEAAMQQARNGTWVEGEFNQATEDEESLFGEEGDSLGGLGTSKSEGGEMFDLYKIDSTRLLPPKQNRPN